MMIIGGPVGRLFLEGWREVKELDLRFEPREVEEERVLMYSKAMPKSLLVSVLLRRASVVATGASRFRMFWPMVFLSSSSLATSISTVSRNLNSVEEAVSC